MSLALPPCTSALAPMADFTTAFDRRVGSISAEWATPVVEVVDTADSIRLALADWEMDNPELLLGLTRLALERHDAQAQEVKMK